MARRITDPLFKTTMCQFIPNCRNGMNCKYAHSKDELRKVMSGNDLSRDDFIYRTKMCDYEELCINEDCGYAHSEKELRRIPCKFQSFCKNWTTTCQHSHFFVDGDGAVHCPVKENTSAAMRTMKRFDNVEKRMEMLDNQVDTVEAMISAEISKSLAIVDEKEMLSMELEALRSEVQKEIDDLDEELNDWMPFKRTTRMTDWAASDSDDDDETPKKTKHVIDWGASDSEDENEPEPVPTKPATWAALLHGTEQPVVIFPVQPPKITVRPPHPAGNKYRTQMCKYGKACNRKKTCGYAHYESQLRLI